MDESQVLGSRIAEIENWFTHHPGMYDALKRDELRTLYATFGDETKALEQSDIILVNQFNDQKTLLLLSESSTGGNGMTSIERLTDIASRFPQFESVRAAARIRAGDLLSNNGQIKLAMAAYRRAFSGPSKYAVLARTKYQNLERSQASVPANRSVQAQ